MPPFKFCALTIALCLTSGIHQGYINSVLNQPYVYIEHFINETIEERFGVTPSARGMSLIWSSLNIMYAASIVGQFLATWTCRRFGRKGTALISCMLYLPGCLLSSLAAPVRSFELLFIGRVLWSLANGLNSVNATVWLVECAPPALRGGAQSLQEFSMALGSLMCQSLGVYLSTSTRWPFVFLPIVPLVLIAMVIFIALPDSPTSSLQRTGDVDKARTALAGYFGVPADSKLVEDEIESLVNKKKKDADKTSQDKKGIAWIFNPFSVADDKMRVVRQAVWLGVFIKLAYTFTGAKCLRAYSTFILHELSTFTLDDAKIGSWIIALLRLPSTLIPVFLVDRIGRRPLLIYSQLGTALALATLLGSILIGGESMKYVSFFAFAMVLLVNSAGVGSVSRFYAAELVPRSLLVDAVATLNGIEALSKIIVDFAFFPVANIIGAYSILVFLVPTIAFLVLIWAKCPETSSRSVYEVLNDIAIRMNIKVSFTSQSKEDGTRL